MSLVHASHSRDDQRGGEEQRSQQAALAVGVLPLALVHLAAAVVTAAAHAEEEPHDRHEDGEQQAHGGAHDEAYLVVDGLGVGGGRTRGDVRRRRARERPCEGSQAGSGERTTRWLEVQNKEFGSDGEKNRCVN